MKKIIGLVIAAIAVIALTAGGTMAYFSDTGKSASNAVQAGTLYLTGGGTKVITSTVAGNALANGTVQDEVTTLAPTGTINTGNYLSIKFINMANTTTGFPSTHVRDLTGTVVSTPGDLGIKGQMACWLTKNSGESAPVQNDIELTPATGTAPVAGTASVLGASPSLTYYPIAQYIGKTSTGYATTDTEYFNNACAAAMAANTYYFHITWKLPDNGKNNDGTGDDNIQGVKVAFDIYFTLATVNNPYP